MNITCEKMILAVMSGNDYIEAVRDLNEHGFYATLLSSTGGFLKKKNVTLMIGLEEAQLENALGILEKHAGSRMDTVYVKGSGAPGLPPVPTKVQCGGVTAFVLHIERCVKF